MAEKISLVEAQKKLEHYCAYQERCHQEVVLKIKQLGVPKPDLDHIVVHLIAHNFLNEERFARSFARGKHRIKRWGKIRIINELKQRSISATNIKMALTEITEAEYQETFHSLAEHHWQTLTDSDTQRKKKKWCDYLLRKGWEPHLVYDKLAEL